MPARSIWVIVSVLATECVKVIESWCKAGGVHERSVFEVVGSERAHWEGDLTALGVTGELSDVGHEPQGGMVGEEEQVRTLWVASVGRVLYDELGSGVYTGSEDCTCASYYLVRGPQLWFMCLGT